MTNRKPYIASHIRCKSSMIIFSKKIFGLAPTIDARGRPSDLTWCKVI